MVLGFGRSVNRGLSVVDLVTNPGGGGRLANSTTRLCGGRLATSTTRLRLLFAFLWLATCGGTTLADDGQPLIIDNLVIGVIDSVEIAARHSGVIAELDVQEGDNVTAGQQLGKLDDRRAALEAATARTQLQIASEQSKGDRGGELAQKRLAAARQSAAEHQLLLQIAKRKAENETRVLAAKKAEAVAKNELDRASRARAKFVDSVSQSEIEGLRLAYDKAQLEAQQARFDRRIGELQADAEREAAESHQLQIERSAIEVEAAVAEDKVQQLEVVLQEQQYELANLIAEQHRFTAPFDGVVAETDHGIGDWVTAGQPILRVIRLDRLRAEGFIDAAHLSALRERPKVIVEIEIPGEKPLRRSGQVTFVGSEIDPVNNEVRFWVEFDNPESDVLPGMRLRLVSKP